MGTSPLDGRQASRVAQRERAQTRQGGVSPARPRGRLRARYLVPLGAALVLLVSLAFPLPNVGAWLAHLRPSSPAVTQHTLRGTALSGAQAPDFQLNDQNGQPISLARFRGQPVVVTFLDSVCPHQECPLMAQYLDWTARFLGADTGRVAWVALSMNPWHDTPTTVRAFLTSHQVTLPLHYVLGSVDQMSALWKAYHMQAILQSDGIVIHSTGVYVLDAQGRERVYLDEGFDPHDLSGDLRTLLSGAPATTSAQGSQAAGDHQTQTINGYAITFTTQPARYGAYAIAVSLRDGQGAPVTGATISADLTMTDMAMEPEHVTLQPGNASGDYTASNVLTMAGRWQAVLHIQLPMPPQTLPGAPSATPTPLSATFQFTART